MSKIEYDELRTELAKPISERKKHPIGRDGEQVIGRRYFLTTGEIEKLSSRYTAGDPFPNPHSRTQFGYVIETLKALGTNQLHSEPDFLKKIEELEKAHVGKNGVNDWDIFVNKPPRNEETCRDADARMWVNVCELQRLGGLHRPGLKLFEVGTKILKTRGAVIDILVDESGMKWFRLNTDSPTPINMTKVRGSTIRQCNFKVEQAKSDTYKQFAR